MNWLHNFLITKFHTESFTFHFYRGLNVEIRSLIDDGVLAIGGYILTRSPEDINDMADFDYHWHCDPSLQVGVTNALHLFPTQ